MSQITIRCRVHGPLVIEGPAIVTDHAGNPFPLNSDKAVIALCRCGHSAKKPFCDGAHKTCGFQADNLATQP